MPDYKKLYRDLSGQVVKTVEELEDLECSISDINMLLKIALDRCERKIENSDN